jgi:hypothetical protein
LGIPYLPPGSGGSGGSKNRTKRKVELFSFELGTDSPVPTRFGLAGKTNAYVPGTRGTAGKLLSAGDIAPNGLYDIVSGSSSTRKESKKASKPRSGLFKDRL